MGDGTRMPCDDWIAVLSATLVNELGNSYYALFSSAEESLQVAAALRKFAEIA
jgi:hypothetical protein